MTDPDAAGSFRVFPAYAGGDNQGAGDYTTDNSTVGVTSGSGEVNVEYIDAYTITKDTDGVVLKTFKNIASANLTVSIFKGTVAEYEAEYGQNQ